MDNHIIINVGRQFGSGGKSVATVLSAKLGIPVYDNELITKAAEASGISVNLFKKSDEKKSFFRLGSIFGSNRYGQFTDSTINEGELFKIQSDVIRDIAENGSAIFVGRASDYVLRDMKCIDAFISAPLEARVTRVSGREKISPEEAETLIRKNDRERERYYNFFTLGHWGVASNYDICLDSHLLGIDKTAELIIEFGRKRGLIPEV